MAQIQAPTVPVADTFKQRFSDQVTPDVIRDLKQWNSQEAVSDARVEEIKKILKNVWGLPDSSQMKLEASEGGAAYIEGRLITGHLKKDADQKTAITFFYDVGQGSLRFLNGGEKPYVSPEDAGKVFSKMADDAISAEGRVAARMQGAQLPKVGGETPLPTKVDLDVGFEMMSDQARKELQALSKTLSANFTDRTPVPVGSQLEKEALAIFGMKSGSISLSSGRGGLNIRATGILTSGQKGEAYANFPDSELSDGEVKVVQ